MKKIINDPAQYTDDMPRASIGPTGIRWAM